MDNFKLLISNFIECGYKNLLFLNLVKLSLWSSTQSTFIMFFWVYENFLCFLFEGLTMIYISIKLCWLYYSFIFCHFFCILDLILKKCFEIYNIFIKLPLNLHCLVHIGLPTLILHMCFILFHSVVLLVPLTSIPLCLLLILLFFSLYLIGIFVNLFIINFSLYFLWSF